MLSLQQVSRRLFQVGTRSGNAKKNNTEIATSLHTPSPLLPCHSSKAPSAQAMPVQAGRGVEHQGSTWVFIKV